MVCTSSKHCSLDVIGPATLKSYPPGYRSALWLVSYCSWSRGRGDQRSLVSSSASPQSQQTAHGVLTSQNDLHHDVDRPTACGNLLRVSGSASLTDVLDAHDAVLTEIAAGLHLPKATGQMERPALKRAACAGLCSFRQTSNHRISSESAPHSTT